MATDERKSIPDPEQDETKARQDDRDLTPPHGDDLRSEQTFGRTDRYSNMDDEEADRTG